MAYNQAYLDNLQFALNYGNTDRTYEAIKFFVETSRANPLITMDDTSFLAKGQRSGAGKKRQLRLVYFPILCEDTGTCSENVCEDGTVVEPVLQTFNITECTASAVYQINADDIRLMDAEVSFTDIARNVMMSALPAFRRKLAMAMITKGYSLAGYHEDGNEFHKIVNLTDAGGRINPLALTWLNKEYTDLGLESPRILGGGDFYAWKEIKAIGGLNDDGVYINRSGNNMVYYDDALQSALFNDLSNGDWALSIDPRTFKLVTFNKNAGMFMTDLDSPEDIAELRWRSTEGYIRGVWYDPMTGLLYDFDAKYDACDDIWKFQWFLEWDMFMLPNITCNEPNSLVNGAMKWRTCPIAIPNCPTGQSPSTPVASDTFSWTPTLADLAQIYNSSINGFDSVQNEPVEITTAAELATYMTNNSNIVFTANGSDIEYTGQHGIAVSFNSGAVTGTFAA
jgi:hypothetical protein